MKTVFEYQRVGSNNYLKSFALEKLEKLVTKYPFIIRADVFFKQEVKNIGKGKMCGIRLSLPGPRIYASSGEMSFENAINNTIDDLKDQLGRRKVKLYKSIK